MCIKIIVEFAEIDEMVEEEDIKEKITLQILGRCLR